MQNRFACEISLRPWRIESSHHARTLADDKFRLKIKLIDEGYIEFDNYVIYKEEMKRLCQETALQIIERRYLKSREQDKPFYELYLLK